MNSTGATLTLKIMKNALKILFVAGLVNAVWQVPGRAADKEGLKDQKEKVSYGIGMTIGSNLKHQNYDVDVDVLAGAIKDELAGKELKLTEAEAREILQSYHNELMA